MIENNLRKLSVIDLFSGAGGFSLAALNCNLDVIAALEIDKSACETYERNIISKRSPKTKLYTENIFDINTKNFRNELGLEQGSLDILIGGPPCQGFSTHRINDKGVNDPRNALLFRYFDFVKELNPKIFLVENVPGLLWKRHENYLNKFRNFSRRHGYKMLEPVKLNAKDYGVPQNRERVFILGIRTDFKTKLLQWPPEKTHFQPGIGKSPIWKNSSEVFNQPPDFVLSELAAKLGKEVVDQLNFFQDAIVDSDPAAIHMRHTDELIKRFELTPINGSREDIDFRLPCHSSIYGGHKDVYGRIRLAQPGPTVTTGCFNPSKGRFLHPWLHHGISIRHAARLQTFPNDFLFSKGISAQGKQVGNAVPIKLGESLLSSIKIFLQYES